MKEMIKKTAWQIAVFSIVVNVVSWTLILLAMLAPLSGMSADMQMILMLYVPSVMIGIAYIIFDLKFGLDWKAELSELFVEHIVRGILWCAITLAFTVIAGFIGGDISGYSGGSLDGFGTAVAVLGGLLMIHVVAIMVVWFVIREIYYRLKH